MFTGSYRYACGWWRFPSWPSNKEVSKRTASTLDLLRTSEDRLLEFSAPTTHWMASTDCVHGLHICFNTFIKILLLLGSPDTSSTHLNATSMIQCDPILYSEMCVRRIGVWVRQAFSGPRTLWYEYSYVFRPVPLCEELDMADISRSKEREPWLRTESRSCAEYVHTKAESVRDLNTKQTRSVRPEEPLRINMDHVKISCSKWQSCLKSI